MKSFCRNQSSFVANLQPSELSIPRLGAFNTPACFTQAATMCCPERSQCWFNSSSPTRGFIFLRPIGPITLKRFRTFSGTSLRTPDRRNRVQQIDGWHRIMNIRRCDIQRQRGPLSVRDHMAFYPGFRTVCGVWPRVNPPKTARLEALSITTRDQSIRPFLPSLLSKYRWILSQISFSCHSRNRRQQVTPLPYPSFSGNICQEIPERRTKMIPAKQFRSGTHGRPPFGWGGLAGKNWEISSHRTPDNNGFAMTFPPFGRFFIYRHDIPLTLGYETRSKITKSINR